MLPGMMMMMMVVVVVNSLVGKSESDWDESDGHDEDKKS